MASQFSMILPYVLVATAAGLIGGIVARFWSPKVRARSAIQHFSAGAVLAAVAANVIPEVERLGSRMGILAGFSTDQQLGTLLVVALALELFFLTLSVGAEFRKGKIKLWQGLAVTSGIAALLPTGAFGAGFFLAGAPGTTLAVVLAFGAAALIYLIAEELLVESIQAEASLFSTAMLFSGFLFCAI